MKSVSFYSRAGLFLLAAALCALTFASIGVIAFQLNTVISLSSSLNEATNKIMLMQRDIDNLKVQIGSLKDTDRHIAVSLKENKLYLMEGDDLIKSMSVATASGRKFRFLNKTYEFVTPIGTFEILRKETDPVWIAPDWNWHEKGETVPLDLTLEQRSFKGVMGKYALRMRDGYAIHGTNQPWSIGRYTSHGCIRVGAKDLEMLFNAVDIGTKVYIY